MEGAMARTIAFTSSLVALLLACPAFAHHPGSTSNTGGAGPINTISASTLEAGHGGVAFIYEYIKFGGIGDADLISAAGKHIHAHSIGTIGAASLSAAYGVTDDLMVAVRVPWVHRSDIREGHHSHSGGVTSNTVDFRGDSSGIGDVTLLGQWRFINYRGAGTEAAFLFGVKAPTGPTNRLDALGQLFETEFQPGSGSWDPLLGVALTQRFGAWSFDANMLYVFATRGAQDINLGDRFQYNAAVSYRLFGYQAPASLTSPVMSHGPVPHRHAHPLDKIPAPAVPQWTVDAILELNGEWHDYEHDAGTKDLNSGGNTLLLSPGLRVARGPVAAFATVGIPIYTRLNGIQSKTELRVLTGLAFAFE
jgi:hypothetical protein